MSEMDFVYVPSSVGRLLFDGVVDWESVESLVSLLTMCVARKPVEYADGFSMYVIRREDVDERFMATSRFREFSFDLNGKDVGFVARYRHVDGGDRGRLLTYWVHDACNPVRHCRQHEKQAWGYPVMMWKLPRHVLIRWRYSERLPVHQSNFSPASDFDFDGEVRMDVKEMVRDFDKFSGLFFSLMCGCDESSLSYGFLCRFYFYLFELFVYGLRRKEFPGELRELFYRAYYGFRKESMVTRKGNMRPYVLEGMMRSIVPKSYYNYYPFSKYTPVRAGKV